MDALNFLLIVIIVYILYSLITNNNKQNKKNNSEKFYSNKKKELINNVIDDIVSWDGSIDSDIIKKSTLNPNFINNKFHNDYRDLITAINNLIPERKQLFNLPNIPVIYSEPETAEVKNIIDDFIKVLNENLKSEVPSYRNPNSGWDEAIPDPNIKSGWDKVQESLGLTPSLWNKSAKKNIVKLINITLVQKYETEDELKYSCDIVLQKNGVDDQIILKTDFVQDKRPLIDENNFFVTKNIDLKIIIENIFIVGYLSKEGNDSRLLFDKDMNKMYDYNQLEYNNMTDPKYIQKILMEKYRNRTQEMEQRNALLDEEGQEFHRNLPHIYDFSNIRGTQTIFDDMNMHKTFI